MKLLACDYDGTFCSDLKNLYLNKKAINKFRKEGNKFAIVTGRSFNSIKREIYNYKIDYDYLACNDGLVLFDKDDNIIKSSPMSNEDLDFICFDLLDKYEKKKVRFFNEQGRTGNLHNILEIYVGFKNILEAQRLKLYFKKNMKHINCSDYLFRAFISNKCTKADAIKIIQEIENIDSKDIYTVGDNKNDLEMLKKYNGYKMLTSYPCLWLEPIPITREVHTLVKKINKK